MRGCEHDLKEGLVVFNVSKMSSKNAHVVNNKSNAKITEHAIRVCNEINRTTPSKLLGLKNQQAENLKCMIIQSRYDKLHFSKKVHLYRNLRL